jgi:hypothetical protein
MKISNAQLMLDACNLVNAADHLLANCSSELDLSDKDCYALAEKLERACHTLLVLGDRKMQVELNKIPMNDEVPF